MRGHPQFIVCLVALLGTHGSPVLGQRVFATVDPKSIQEELKFDVNTLPLLDQIREEDLNFAPNILFAPDSSKAFVSYTGSHKVVVFDPATGAILKLIDAGKHPALLTLTPDGKKVAAVSLFFSDNLPQPATNQGKLIGAISIIDIETLAVKTLNLEKVFFSFANNIVFSGDSRTGFIASSGTDEILRFDIETATEVGPRLQLKSGTRPSSITMARDHSFFAVVLVGSPFLDKNQSPDSIEIIDTASFSVRKSIVPKVEKDEPVHDFFATNTVTLSADGKYGVVGDREISSSPFSSIPALSRDHALLFDVEKAEVIKSFSVGGLASFSVLMPDGKSALVVSELELSIIDLNSQEERRITPPRSNFKSTTRPGFSPDGTFMYLAAPIDDRVLVFNLKTGEIKRLVKVGPKEESQSEATLLVIPAAPLDLAVSPNGQILAVLNFNANTIDLLQSTTPFYVPRLLSTGEWFTGVAITNNASQEAEIILQGISNVAIPFQDELSTQDVVEFVNPLTLTLGAGKQTAFTAHGLFQSPGQTPIEGWLDADSNRSQIASFFMMGDGEIRRLDGGLAGFATASAVVLPEVRVWDGFVTEIAVLNPNISLTNIKVTLVSQEGKPLGEVSRPLIGGGVFTGFVRDPNPESDTVEGIFPDSAFQDFVSGYVTVTSEEGILAFQRYYDGQRLASLNGVPVRGQSVTLDKTLYLPQVARLAGTETFLNFINTATEKATVTLSLKSNQGLNLAEPVTVELEPAHAVRKRLEEIFKLATFDVPLSGWVLMESDRSGFLANAEIQAFNGKAMTAISGHSAPANQFLFAHVAEGFGLSTGLALVNPGSENAVVQISVFNPDGVQVASRKLVLESGHREARLLKEWFTDLPQLLGGYIKISSTQKIVGLELFFADNLELMASVPPQLPG